MRLSTADEVDAYLHRALKETGAFAQV